jgi:hypothetical protein
MRLALFVLLGVLVFSCLADLEPGIYVISDIIMRDVPGQKRDGRGWDSWGGAPDLFIIFKTETDDDDRHLFTTNARENSGDTEIWSSSWEFSLQLPEIESDHGYLTVNVWDEDMSNHDFVDNGSIGLSDLVIGENTIDCVYGCEITFDLIAE